MLEVELRGTLTESEFTALKHRLNTEGVASHSDDKTTYFFVTRGFILKVTQPDGASHALITVKLGDETANVLEELDIQISPISVNNALALFRELGFNEINKVVQKRTNYTLGQFELALKFTDDWGYHFELEGSASDNNDATNVRARLAKVCQVYGLRPMTSEQIRQKIEAINASHGFKGNS